MWNLIKHKVIWVAFFMQTISLFAQNQQIPLQTFFKQQGLRFSPSKSIETFYPMNESQLNLTDSLKDKQVFYYDLFHWMVKKNWVDIVTPEGKISINPIVNLSLGKAKTGSIPNRLFQNTRGVTLSGELLKKTSFLFVFCENQGQYQSYESAYFKDRGELYDFGNSYSKQNAVIPSGSRTKPFKTDGFDYAFSYGNIAFQAHKKLRIEMGNNQHFIGNGYRSILLSDNSIYAPYIRLNYTISTRFSYQFLVKRNLNLIRKPATNAVESAYEKKLFTVNYLTFKPIDKIALSLFSASNQLLTDSLIRHKIDPTMFIPVPGLNTDLLKKSQLINGIAGVNIDIALKRARFYGQYALDFYNEKQLNAFQLGMYWFDLLKIKNLTLQLEVNHVPEKFYQSDHLKLSYSQGNIPLAHPKGNNFTELFTRIDYSFKRFYVSNNFIVYFSKGGTVNSQIRSNTIFREFTLNQDSVYLGNTIINNFELGYRINKRYNPTLFLQLQGRASNYEPIKLTNTMYLLGVRVNLFNQYFDF